MRTSPSPHPTMGEAALLTTTCSPRSRIGSKTEKMVEIDCRRNSRVHERSSPRGCGTHKPLAEVLTQMPCLTIAELQARADQAVMQTAESIRSDGTHDRGGDEGIRDS